MTTTPQARVQSGVPTGGQWATTDRNAADVTLSAPRPAPPADMAPDTLNKMLNECAGNAVNYHGIFRDRENTPTEQRSKSAGIVQAHLEAVVAATDVKVPFDEIPSTAGVRMPQILNSNKFNVAMPLSGDRCDQIGDHFMRRALHHRLTASAERERDGETASMAIFHDACAEQSEQLAHRFYSRGVRSELPASRIAAALREVLDEAEAAVAPRALYQSALQRAYSRDDFTIR